jgi:hypothetical protein
MKLPIKKKYFDEIKSGKKINEYRDAHITFVCEETGEKLRMDVETCSVIDRTQVPLEYRNAEGLTENRIIKFRLKNV